MELKFNIPEFRPGLNVTVRNRQEKYLDVKPGTEVDIVQTDKPEDVLGIGQIVETVPCHWRNDQDKISGLTTFNHETDAREINGLAQAMNRAYGMNEWGPEVVVVLFVVQDDLVTKVLTEADAQADIDGEPRPDNPSVPVPAETESVPSTEAPVPTEPQEVPVPRADEDATPITKFHTDDSGLDWAYQLTASGTIVLAGEPGSGWVGVPAGDVPVAIQEMVSKLTS